MIFQRRLEIKVGDFLPSVEMAARLQRQKTDTVPRAFHGSQSLAPVSQLKCLELRKFFRRRHVISKVLCTGIYVTAENLFMARGAWKSA